MAFGIAGHAIIAGEERITNMIVRFQNVRNEVNYGIIVDTDPGGMVDVFWDTFAALLERLEQGNRVSDFVRAGLSKRRSWIRVEAQLPPGALLELLPISSRVPWNDNELATVQAQLIREEKLLVMPDVAPVKLEQASEASNVFRGQEVN